MHTTKTRRVSLVEDGEESGSDMSSEGQEQVYYEDHVEELVAQN